MPNARSRGTLNGGPIFPAWLRALFAWEIARDTGATIYWQNAITGARRASRVSGGHQPIDRHWLATGEWSPLPEPPTGGPSERRPSIFPHFDVDAPMPRPFNRALVRDALIQARAVLITCASDRPDDLARPERARVLTRRIETLTVALAELDGREVEKPRIRVPYRREPEVQIVDRIGGSFTARAPVGDPVWGPMPVRRDPPPPDTGGVTVRPCGA